MKRTILNRLGINATKDIPIEDIFSPGIDRTFYGLDETDLGKLRALKSFCYHYSVERPVSKGRTITCSGAAAELMYDILRDLGHEEVWIAYLSAAGKVIDRRKICVGGLDQTVMDERRILLGALELNAKGMILFHNHPSGNSKPSLSDIKQTESLQNICKVLNISLLDHIIISSTEYYSFQEDNANPIPQVKRK